jgi:hypothetical protein
LIEVAFRVCPIDQEEDVALKEFSAPASHNPAALGGQADMPTKENFFQPADAKIAASVSQVFAWSMTGACRSA